VSSSLSTEAIKIIAYLLHFEMSSFTINIMNVGRQTESQECGLYSIAYLTSIAHGEDPTAVKYNQDDMRCHLIKCFEKNELFKFPSQIRRKIKGKMHKKEHINVYCSLQVARWWISYGLM
jgi:hypothetical protein